MASLQGWGRQTWNSGAWNTFAPVDATGNGLTSSLGSLTLTGDCNITLTGIGTTSTVGTAVGTGLNTEKGWDKDVSEQISKITKIPFRPAPNKFEALAAHDGIHSVRPQEECLIIPRHMP